MISGVYNTGLNLGMALGVCIFEAIFSFRVLRGKVSPAGMKIHLNDLAGGFQNIYQFAGLLFLVALGISVILLVKRNKI